MKSISFTSCKQSEIHTYLWNCEKVRIFIKNSILTIEQSNDVPSVNVRHAKLNNMSIILQLSVPSWKPFEAKGIVSDVGLHEELAVE